jgi:hypothetical protein
MAEKWQLSGVEKALAFWEGEAVRLRGVLRELLAGSGSLEQAG